MKKAMSPNSVEIRDLVNVALGKEKADLAIVGGDLVNVYTGEILKEYSVAIKGEWIAFMGNDASRSIGPETEIIDASGKTIVPGFIDGHTHILWFYCLEEFLKYAIRSGTTTIISETIDMAFTLGYEGIIQFMESARDQPVKIFATLPSTFANGQALYADAISSAMFHELLSFDEVLGLGETNWLPVIKGDERVLNLFADTLDHGKKLEGHLAGARGNKLVACAASGISSCHEAITAPEALERLRLGLHVMIREGDIRKDLEAVSRIKDENIDFRRLAVASDSVGAKHLMEQGYMDYVVQRAIDLGFDPITAIQMATLNVAEHFSIDDIVGGIAPGKFADMVIIPDPVSIKPECVISRGRVVARHGKLTVKPRKYVYPESSRTTIHLPRNFEAADFAIQVDNEAREVTVRVIDLSPSIMNKEALLRMSVSEGKLRSDIDKDILKIAAIDRSNDSGKMFVGLVRGFQLKKGAFAATANWDVSNILVVGASDEDMAGAVNRIREIQGGSVVFADGKVHAELPMPIAGHLSDLPMEAIAEALDSIQQKLKEFGCPIPNPHLILTTFPTPILPSLRISIEGLIDIKEGRLIDLVVS